MNDVKQLHIPARLKDQADLLVTYCDDRVASYHLMYKAVTENSTEYNDSINYCNYQVREVLDELEKTVQAKK
jgi:arylsulfatase A-like enzyme